MKTKLKLKYKKPLSFLVALCIIAGLVPLLSVPASATTVGSWRVYTGTSAADATHHSTHTGNNSLRNAFNVYANTGANFVRIHHTGNNVAYDIGATNPGFHIGSGRTLALTGNAATYWDGGGGRHIFHLNGGTLYVGQNITLNKTGSWSAVGATGGTSTLYNFGTISRSGGQAIHIDSGRTLNHFSWVNSTVIGGINNQGTHNRTWLCTLTLSSGTGVSSVNFPTVHHNLPLQMEGFLAYNRPASGNQTINIPEPAYETHFGAPHEPVSFTMTTTSTTFNLTVTATRIQRSVTAPANTSLTVTSVGSGLAYNGTLNANTGWNRPASITMTRGGAAFTNFSYNAGTGAISIAAAQTTGDFVIRGTATRIEYPVTFNANGGTGAPSNQTKQHGINLTLSNTIPTRDKHDFIEWNTREDGTGTAFQPGEIYSGNAALTLFAQWTPAFTVNTIVDDQTTNFTVHSDDLLYVLENHVVTDDDIANNNWVTLALIVSEKCEDTAKGAEQIIDRTRGRLMQFFNITVTKTINDNPPITLSELPVPIQVVIDLSPEMSGRRGYSVYRFHDNEVQLLGMDVSDGEYYTISRGTSEKGTDQVIINTMRFSTYAVVENIRTIEGAPGSDDVDVQARIVDKTSRVYKIDIEWGDMRFIFNTGSDGSWNPDTREVDGVAERGWSGFDGGNNQIIVTNHSNADVLVSFDMTDNILAPAVFMYIYKTNDENGEAAIDMPLGKVPSAHLTDDEPSPSITAYLRLKGEPSQEDIDEMKNAEAWHRVGIITVTIAPDGYGLTPR